MLKNTILQTQCDAVLDDLYNQLLILQPKYKDEILSEDILDEKGIKTGTREYKRGEYFQGLLTPPTIPKDGETLDIINTIKVSNLKENYTDLGIITLTKVPCSIRIDVYENEKVLGWVLIGTVEDTGNIYERALNSDPQDDEKRNKNWTIVEDSV